MGVWQRDPDPPSESQIWGRCPGVCRAQIWVCQECAIWIGWFEGWQALQVVIQKTPIPAWIRVKIRLSVSPAIVSDGNSRLYDQLQ